MLKFPAFSRVWVILVCVGFVSAAPPGGEGESAALRPGDNLVIEGIPGIPMSLVESINRYTEFRGAGLSSWHPTRLEMLISTRFADTSQVHRVKMPGGARTQLTFFADRVAGGAYPPKRDDYFIFAKDSGGGEWFQIHRYDLGSGETMMLTDGKSRNVGGAWSTAGDRIAYMSTRRTGKDMDLWIMDPTDRKSDKLLLELAGGGWGAADWSPDDGQLLLAEYLSVNESYLWLVDVAKGEKKLITPKVGRRSRMAMGSSARMGRGFMSPPTRSRSSRGWLMWIWAAWSIPI
jgi:hypothetical protein